MVSFEVLGDGLNLRVELELGGPAYLTEAFTAMVRQVLAAPTGPEPPVEATPDPNPPAAVVEPEPEPAPAVDPESEEPVVSAAGSAAEVLALLADAGGELSDEDGNVTAKIAELLSLRVPTVSNALVRLKSKGWIMAVTSGRRTTRVTLTLSGWEAAGQSAPLTAVDEPPDRAQRARDRAADAVGQVVPGRAVGQGGG